MSRTFQLLLAGCFLLYALLAWRFWWVCDDAYIAFRFSRNFAAGLGLTYNPGIEPPVEGYTQLGWVLWIGLFEWLGADPTVWSRLTTFLGGAGLLAYVVRHARRVLGDTPGASCAAAGLFAALPMVAVWATGGLGTMVFSLILFATYERLLGDPQRPRGGQAGLLAALASVMRADAPYFLGMILGLGLLRSGSRAGRDLRRQTLRCAGLLAVALAAQVGWRYATYGEWLPNTVHAKASLSAVTLQRGLYYVITQWLTVPALVLVPLAAAPLLRRNPWQVGAQLALVGWSYLYGVLVGGDFMAMGRFLLPAAPFLALLLGGIVDEVGARRGRLVGALAATAALLLALPASFDLHPLPRSLRERFHFRWSVPPYASEWRVWRRMVAQASEWSDLGHALALHTRPGESLVHTTIGAVGYYSGLIVYDRHGLVSREVNRELGIANGGYNTPGHDRVAPDSFFERFHPTYRMAAFARGARPPQLPANMAPPQIHRVEAEEGVSQGGYLLLWRYEPAAAPAPGAAEQE